MLRARFFFDIVLPALVLCWAAMFIYNAAAGDSGFGALSALNRDVDSKTAEVDALRARRIELEKRADQLSSRALDPDLADERIRAILGYAREGDVVISRDALESALGDRESDPR
jgi:cell division protein FtsB